MIEQETMLRVGYAQQRITPALEPPVYLAGFGRNRVAQTVHDDLYVRALALQHGDTHGNTPLVLAALDLIGLARVHCQEIAGRVEASAPGARCILASTHTHHGPDTLGLWGPDMATSGVNPDYLANLKATVASACLAALERMQPAQLRAASVRVPGVTKNARDPEIVDDELTCLQFCSPAGRGEAGPRPVATLLDFPCHPEVLWEHNPHITSDYPGFLRRRVEAETGVPCLFFSGAVGGMMTPDVQDHSFAEAEAMGETLARAALDALSDAPAIEVDVLTHARRAFAVPMTNPLFQMAMQAGLLPDILDGEGGLETEANLVKIGPAWLAGVPGELLPKLGLEIKARLRQAGARVAAVVGLANDELGYILPQEDFVYPQDPFEPGEHYEETMSVGPEAGPRLMDALRGLVGR